MQIKLYTVDFQLSPNAKRTIRYALLPLAVFAGAAGMARAYDTSWIQSGQPVSSSKLKSDLDEAQTRLTRLETNPTIGGGATVNGNIIAAGSGSRLAVNIDPTGRYGRQVIYGNEGIDIVAAGPATLPTTPGADLNLGATGGLDAVISANWYYSGNHLYTRDGAAARLGFVINDGSALGSTAGAFVFQSAPKGTAGTTVTWANKMVLSQAGNLQVNGNITATGSITPGSSRTLKDNIQNLALEDAQATVRDLRAVRFYYKADSTEEHLGFIAEDVPALVATRDRRGVDPMDIAAVLTQVVQSQQRDLEAQRRDMEAQRHEIAELRKERSALETQRQEIAELRRERTALEERLSRLERALATQPRTGR